MGNALLTCFICFLCAGLSSPHYPCRITAQARLEAFLPLSVPYLESLRWKGDLEQRIRAGEILRAYRVRRAHQLAEGVPVAEMQTLLDEMASVERRWLKANAAKYSPPIKLPK